MPLPRCFAFMLTVLGAAAMLANEVRAQERVEESPAKGAITLETCVLTLERDSAKHFLALAGFKSGKIAFLAEEQLSNWFEVFEHDWVTNWTITRTDAPKVTVSNGQTATITAGDDSVVKKAATAAPQILKDPLQYLYLGVGDHPTKIKSGLAGSVVPDMSADCNFVRLQIDLTWTSVYSASGSKSTAIKLTLDKVVMVPGGHTMVYHLGKAKGENLYQQSVPGLSDIPYLGDLLTGYAYFHGEREVFLLVTPRVVEQE